jgi:hypothetical protein
MGMTGQFQKNSDDDSSGPDEKERRCRVLRWPILKGLLNMRSVWSRSGGIMEGAAADDR